MKSEMADSKTSSQHVSEQTVSRIKALVAASFDELNRELKADLAKVKQDLISRGLSQTTVQRSDSRSVCDRNLHKRCGQVVEAIKRVVNAHRVGPSESMRAGLRWLFTDCYSDARTHVKQEFISATEKNKAPGAFNYDGISVAKYVIEIDIFVDELHVQIQNSPATAKATVDF